MTMTRLDAVGGWLMIGVLVTLVIAALTGEARLLDLAVVLSVLLLVLLATRMSRAAQISVIVALVACGAAFLWRNELAVLQAGARRATQLAGLVVSISTIRNAARGSPLVANVGRALFAVSGRQRTVFLVLATHFSGVILSFGVLNLFGAVVDRMVEESAEPADSERLRLNILMLRASAAVSAWSPLAVAMVVSLLTIPGVTWLGVLPWTLFSAAIVLGLALLVAGRNPAGPQNGSGANLLREPAPWRLLSLVAILVITIPSVAALLDVHMSAATLLSVPIFSLVWMLLQEGGAPGRTLRFARRVNGFVSRELPVMITEFGFIMSASLLASAMMLLIDPDVLAPFIAGLGSTNLLIPVLVMWIFTLLAPLGLNAVFCGTLFAALYPLAAVHGVSPVTWLVAVTGGFMLWLMISPMSIIVLIAARQTGHSVRDIIYRQNLGFAFVSGGLLSLWVVVVGVLMNGG